MRATDLRRLALKAFFPLAVVSVAHAQSYTITDLGTLKGGSYAEATGIDASGQITGYSALNSGIHAVLWSGGRISDLGTLGGEYSLGLAINGSGAVVGYSTLANGSYRAFLSSAGKITNIGTLGGNYSSAYGINTSGQVVGSANTANNHSHAFLYSAGKMTDLGTLGGDVAGWSTIAYAINDSSVAVGYSYLADGDFHAFSYSNGSMHDLGTLGGDFSQAYAINSAGQITGQAYLKGNARAHAFLLSNGSMRDLGAFNYYSSGFSVDKAGVVVGEADVPNNTGYLIYHAVIYSGGKLTDLNNLIPKNSGWVLTAANSINDSGWIVGYGTVAGNQHAFLLTPKTPASP